MEIFTPGEAARTAGTKYRAVLVAAKFARMLNEMPADYRVRWDDDDRQSKLTTLSLKKLVTGDLGFRELRRRRSDA